MEIPATTLMPSPGSYVATVNYKLSNWQLTTTERPVGDAAGYANIDDALEAAYGASAGQSRSAVAVLEDGDRFRLAALDGAWRLVHNPKVGEPPTRFTWLEHVASSPFPDLWKQARWTHDGTGRQFDVHQDLRAIVDGVAQLMVR